jgi:hypothetical protein
MVPENKGKSRYSDMETESCIELRKGCVREAGEGGTA